MWAQYVFERRRLLKIVAISDHTGGYTNKDGINVSEAIKYLRSNGFTLEGWCWRSKNNQR
ncbi:MAG: hypothetical protein R3B47_10005 [Bacteroidia bacterium]